MNDEAIARNTQQNVKIRQNTYRLLALIATLLFLICAYISMVPGMYPIHQLVLISSAAILLISTLLVGLWRFRKRETLLAKWLFDAVVGIILISELVECCLGIAKVLPLIR